jgi:hypothetical protein
LLVLAGIVTLILCKDIIIRNLTERQIINQTGMYVRIDRMHVGFREPVITMENFKLYNRPEFGGGLLVHLGELHMEYDPEALQSGKLHLYEFRLDLETLNIVCNQAGETNLVDFIQRAGTEGTTALTRRLPAREFGFTGIDELTLSLGSIRFIDLRDPRRNKEAHFGVDDLTVKNIRSEGDLYGVAGLVLLRSGLVNLGTPPAGNPENASGVLEMGWDWVLETLGLRPPPAAPNRTPEPADP